MVDDNKPAPNFIARADDGTAIELKTLKGRVVVLYFYPKDDTSGCTSEAKDFASYRDEFAAAGADVIGVSPDSVASHQKFIKKHDLNFRLVADEDKAIATAYGVWVEKSMYGKKYMGVERSTFLIDKMGTVAMSWRKVKVPSHVATVLAAARALAP